MISKKQRTIKLNRFALIGKNISHSLSPSLYKKFISESITYDLLDFSEPGDLPSLKSLMQNYDGVNITAPFKKHYLVHAQLDAQRWMAVNCLKFRNGKVLAINTDALALQQLIPKLFNENSISEVIVLGSGSMAYIVEKILSELKIKSVSYSRQKGFDLSSLKLKERHQESSLKLIINTCSREYSFTENLDHSWYFWDLNYLHAQHLKTLPDKMAFYLDGYSLLELQAKLAVEFWKTP